MSGIRFLTVNNICRLVNKTLNHGSLQQSKWEIFQHLQKSSPLFNLTTKARFSLKSFLKNRPLRVSKSKKYSAAGLGCISAYALRAGVAIHPFKSAKCEEAENHGGILFTDEVKPIIYLNWEQLWHLISKDIVFLIAAVACAIIVAAINVKIPLLLGDVIDAITQCTSGGTSNFLEMIRKPSQTLFFYYLAHGAWTFCYISLITKVGEKMARSLRLELFKALIEQDIAFYDEHKTGQLMERLTADIQDFKSSFKLCLSQGLKALTQTIGCTVSLLVVSPQLSLSVGLFLGTAVFIGSIFGKELRQFSRKAANQMSKATDVAAEAIGNIRTVRTFAMEPRELQLYEDEVVKASHLNMRLGFGIAAFQALSNMAINGILLAVVYNGGMLMMKNQISPGDLMSFLVATQTIQKSLAQLSVLFGQAIRGASAGGRVFEYICLKPKLPLTGGYSIPYHSFYGHVSFKDITFCYPTRPFSEVLQNFNLDITGGQMVALVGPSGAGKSTVGLLLQRLYELSTGSVTVDGKDVKDLDPSWLRGSAIGYISQEPILFGTTILENIRYGKPDATDTEVMEAAELANAHDFIREFPKGYDTLVGERGVTLSGGQKQRIAIARALIKNPSILILDEATSSLDAESERLVQNALDRVSKGRTVIVIAHRLSTVQKADLIAVMADGKIVESGTHEALMKMKGMYYELMRQQTLFDGSTKSTIRERLEQKPSSVCERIKKYF